SRGIRSSSFVSREYETPCSHVQAMARGCKVTGVIGIFFKAKRRKLAFVTAARGVADHTFRAEITRKRAHPLKGTFQESDLEWMKRRDACTGGQSAPTDGPRATPEHLQLLFLYPQLDELVRN